MLPRDAFFARTEQVSYADAVGRCGAEMITPYPPYPPYPPAVLPGEVMTREVLDYVRSGLEAGMRIPEPQSLRVVER